jgi:hypothetical protein
MRDTFSMPASLRTTPGTRVGTGRKAKKEAVMQFFTEKRVRLFAPLALGLICLFACLALRAGDELTDEKALAEAAPPSNPPLNVREANVDAGGNIRVHEQGTVAVSGTVNVGNAPKTQDVNVVNDPLEVTLPDQGVTQFFDFQVDDFNEQILETIDIHKYAHVRFQTNVNGSGTVEYFLSTDGGVKAHFEVEASGNHTVDLGEAAGTRLTIQVVDPDGEQVFIRVFGSN